MSAPDIAGYTYVGHLGSGGFADVFLYEQQWPSQRVAIKVIRPGVALTEREKGLFAAEANAMGRLGDHPNIVGVMTAGMTRDGRPYLVMRYCPPPDLGVRVRNNPMPVADALSTGIKLASAVETAHRSGLLHRDIKPSNVLVTTYHEPALTDFGIAGHMNDLADDEVRISYPWSPPEMLDGRSNGSVASDVYSLGATIWHLLVGRSPFSIPNGDNSTRALSARILHASPPATQRSDVPPALDRLLQQCLAKDPAHRPTSALELARGLQRIEAAAGYPRTAVAVEGDRDTGPIVGAEESDDRTALKPVTVVSASGPRTALPQPTASPAGAPQPASRGTSRATLVWSILGLLVVVALVIGLIVRGGGGSNEPPPSQPTTTSPQSLGSGPVAAPRVTGKRVDARTVRFTLAPATGAADNGYLLTLDGKQQRVPGPTFTAHSAKKVCVTVSQVGADGSPGSPTDACAG